MRSTTRRAAAAIASLLLALGVLGYGVQPHAALGAPAAAKHPTSKPAPLPQIVTIKKADGSAVRGKVLATDAAHLSLAPVEGNAFGQPVDIPWKNIKTVSNGLTQKKAQDAWKVTHKDELCDACHGDAASLCEICKGTGHDRESSKDCKTCKGDQQVKCSQPKCDNGKVPCPAPCLKLSEGRWTTAKDGKQVRTFKVKGGTVTASEEHVGQTGKFEGATIQFADCPTCGKTGSVNCPACHGTGFIPCPTCKADKKAADCTSCDDGAVACSSCVGSGLKGGAAPSPASVPAPVSTGQLPPITPPANVKAGGAVEPKPDTKKSTGDGLD